MPSIHNVTAWNFDPAFWSESTGGNTPPGWTASNGGGRTTLTSPSAADNVDLGPLITNITLTDENDDGELEAGDTINFGGSDFTISNIFAEDVATIDGVQYDIVTIYANGQPGDFNPAPYAYSFAVDQTTGDMLGAFDGEVSATDVSNSPSAYAVSTSELPCFTLGTMIATPTGDTAVENLKVGHLVLTRDAGSQPIRWIGSRRVSRETLGLRQHLLPIRIRAGALGTGQPNADLLVSPQHRILVRSKIAKRMVGSDELLVAAKHLLDIEGIEIAKEISGIEYFHILFDAHQIVVSNGAETESLYTGPQALKTVGNAARAEIFELFPELREGPSPTPAGGRPFLSGRQGRQLSMRHVRNGKPLVSEHSGPHRKVSS